MVAEALTAHVSCSFSTAIGNIRREIALSLVGEQRKRGANAPLFNVLWYTNGVKREVIYE